MAICAVVNKETSVIENIIMAEPTDFWQPTSTFLALIPDNMPVNIGHTYVDSYFYDNNGQMIIPNVIVEDSI